MGVSFYVDYIYGFTWTFPDRIDEEIVWDIINFLSKLSYYNGEEICYIRRQYSNYYKSKKIAVGIDDRRLKSKYLMSFIDQQMIEEIFEEDRCLRNSTFLNYLHDRVKNVAHNGETEYNPECAFTKRDFYDDPVELSKKSWEITERNDIMFESEHDYEYSVVQKIYNFLQNINNIYAEGCSDDTYADIVKIWNECSDTTTDNNKIFKRYSITGVSH